LQESIKAICTAFFTASALDLIGLAPGWPVQIGHIKVLGFNPFSLEARHLQNNFSLVTR
jgi:hypothetical protein